MKPYILIIVLFLLTACTKKEWKTNFSNVKEGVKKDWSSVKKSTSETTEEYKNH